MACAPSEDSDQPGHPPSLIRVFAVYMKKTWVLSYPLSAQRRLCSDWADAQADLSLCWAHMPFCWFCHVAAQVLISYEGSQFLAKLFSYIVVHQMLVVFEPDHEKTCPMPYANNKGTDQPAHSRSLISAFVVHCLYSIISILAISKVSRL